MGTATLEPGDRNHPDPEVVQWFLDYFWIRHPVSRDTVAAYRADLLDLSRWLTTFRNKTLVAASDQDVREFLESRYRSGCRALSDMPSLSCIKRFYFYLADAGLRADDPTEHVYVRTPRLGRQDLTIIQSRKT
jgi:integrase/recombinase XerD